MNRPWAVRSRGRIWAAIAIVVLVVAAMALTRLPKRSSALASMTTEAVERRDIAVTVEATGTVEPINLVEVKSKASGQITRMPVEIGSVVQSGDLLVQVDPRDVQNAYDQARAALVAAEAKANVARDQRKRSDDLFQGQVITASEHEQAQLDEANAQAALVTARTNLDLAKQRLEDATVRAPLAGTILDKPVSVGQVISSATSSVSGGTTLLQMADLSRIRVRALVAETDIGKVQQGQGATVVVDAYPQRSFQGVVEKIEPQAVVQQSVTMFPVLISISNDERLLLPGMNGEVTMLVDQHPSTLSVSLDALRSLREFAPLAQGLGMNADSLRTAVRAEMSKTGGRGRGAGMAAAGGVDGRDSLRARGWGRRGGMGTGVGMGPGSGAGGDSARFARMRGRGGPWGGGQMDPERAARWRARMAERMRAGAEGGAGSSGSPPGTSAAGGGMSPGSESASRFQIAVVKAAKGLEPRVVRIGLSNYDYAEVVDGLKEGEQVVQLGVLEMQKQREQTVSRVRQGVGGGITGGGAGGAGAGGGSGGGGRRASGER